MPITPVPSLYPTLTFEQANPLLAGAKYGMGIGNDMADIISKNLEQQKASTLLPFVKPEAEQALQKATLENKWYPQLQQSLIGLQGAQAKEATAAAIRQEIINAWLKGSGNQSNPITGETSGTPQYGAPPQQQSLQTQPAQPESAFSNNSGMALGKYMSGQGAPIAGLQSLSSLSSDQSPEDFLTPEEQGYMSQFGTYGVPKASLTHGDVVNSLGFGINTFNAKQELAKQQMQEEYKKLTTSAQAATKKAQASNDQLRNLYQYNKYMEQAEAQGLTGLPNLLPGAPNLQTGAIGGYLPAVTSAAQQVNNIQSSMLMPALADMQNALHGAIRNIPELSATAATKPARTWNKKTRETFTDRFIPLNKRANEEAQFFQAAQNPELRMSDQDAHAAWNSFSNHFPVYDSKGNAIPENVGHGYWKAYLTPRAVYSIKRFGNYNPITKESIEREAKARNISVDELQKENKRLGRITAVEGE